MQLNINLWVLQAILIGLRTFGIVEWEWIVVFLPIIIPMCLVLGLVFMITFVLILAMLFSLLGAAIDSVRK